MKSPACSAIRGCGKTTALRAVAGFEQPERGRIALQERTLSDGRLFVPPHLRASAWCFKITPCFRT